jgi:hypothetical protein
MSDDDLRSRLSAIEGDLKSVKKQLTWTMFWVCFGVFGTLMVMLRLGFR